MTENNKDRKPSLLRNDKRDKVRRESLERMKALMKSEKYQKTKLGGDDK